MKNFLQKHRLKIQKLIVAFVLSFLFLFLLSILLRLFVYDIVIVGDSVCCNLQKNDLLLISKIGLTPENIKRGDVVFIKTKVNESEPERLVFGQLVAFPGEYLFTDRYLGKFGILSKDNKFSYLAEKFRDSQTGLTPEEIQTLFEQIEWLDEPTFTPRTTSTDLYERLFISEQMAIYKAVGAIDEDFLTDEWFKKESVYTPIASFFWDQLEGKALFKFSYPVLFFTLILVIVIITLIIYSILSLFSEQRIGKIAKILEFLSYSLGLIFILFSIYYLFVPIFSPILSFSISVLFLLLGFILKVTSSNSLTKEKQKNRLLEILKWYSIITFVSSIISEIYYLVKNEVIKFTLIENLLGFVLTIPIIYFLIKSEPYHKTKLMKFLKWYSVVVLIISSLYYLVYSIIKGKIELGKIENLVSIITSLPIIFYLMRGFVLKTKKNQNQNNKI